MHSDVVIYSIFLIFAGAALAATLALYARQALPVAYLLVGVIVGPWGLGWVENLLLLKNIANIGIIFLLFLLGLNLYPSKLIQLFRETSVVTLVSALVFMGTGMTIAWLFGFAWLDALIIGIACIFSSTIIGLKLLPTTVLHHRRTGEVMISVLLLQDVIAIMSLLLIQGISSGDLPVLSTLMLFAALPLVTMIAWLLERFVIRTLFVRFDRIPEYVFLIAIAWCLGIAQLAYKFGLSYEIGAFIAGVAVARNPISRFIAESLKPLRDFFLVIFFFALGAGFDVMAAIDIVLPAILLSGILLVMKPYVFQWLFARESENDALAWEAGVRLGQMSEFSLLLALVALQSNALSQNGMYLIQLATILSFLVSTYFIVSRFPSPIAASDELRRD